MKHSRYLVTTSVGNRSWHTVWESGHELPLDHPAIWSLCETETGLRLKHSAPEQDTISSFDIPLEDTRQGVEFTLPPTVLRNGAKRQVKVSILRVPQIPPAYLPTSAGPISSQHYRTSDLYVYSGVADFMLNYRRVRRMFGCILTNHRIFAFYKSGDGYKVKAYIDEVVLETADGDFLTLSIGIPDFIDAAVFEGGTVRYGDFWWRVNQVERPEELPRIHFDDDVPESIWFKRVGRSLGFSLIALTILVQILGHTIFREKKMGPPQQITLKQPKILPLAQAKPSPTPKPRVAQEKPKPKKRTPPKKMVSRPKSPPKIAKAPAPRPRPARPAPAKRTAPVVARRAAAPKPPPPNPAVNAQAQLAKSLSFLSPSKNRAAAIASDTTASHYKENLAAADVKDMKRKSSLRDLSSQTSDDIDTRNTHEIQADGGITGSQRKGLNEVQGKVSLNALYDPNAGANLGSAASGKSFSVSGPGSIPESLVEKVLAKYLSKFQYCYERALLGDASLAGTVVVQWTIEPDGNAASVKVVRSQIPSRSMQSCLTEQIGRITFPKPSGGSVIIKYPFAFSSSSL